MKLRELLAMGDRQKNQVYAWESAWTPWNKNVTKRYNLRRWIRGAERKYRIAPTKIVFLNRIHRAKKYAAIASGYEPDDHLITLGWSDHNVPIALHEAAHAITDSLFGHDLEAHCPLWLGIYLWLLKDAKVAPWSALEASAKEFKLKWVPIERTAPRAIRKYFAHMLVD